MNKISKEKLEYLRKNTKLSPFNKMRMAYLKSQGVSSEELERIEYEERFNVYQKGWEKTWKNLNWGEKENENLIEFSDSALEQAISEENKKTR